MQKSLGSREQTIVANLLFELREATGFTQSAVAATLGHPQSFIHKIETGERRLDILELRALLEVLGTSLLAFSEVLERRLSIPIEKRKSRRKPYFKKIAAPAPEMQHQLS